MKWSYIIISILVWGACCMHAQTSIDQWLLSANQDPAVIQQNSLMQFRKNHPQTLKLLDKIELRTQTDEFALNQQQYSLRFSGTRWSELKAQKSKETLDQEFIQLDADEVLLKALMDRYTMLLDNYLMQQEIQLLQEQDAFNTKKIKYLESLIQHQVQDDIKVWIQSLHKNDRLTLRKNQLIQKRERLYQEMQTMGLAGNLEIIPNFWIQPEEILKVGALLKTDLSHHTKVKAFYLDQMQLAQERAQKKSEQWDILNFVQARWRNNSNDEFFKEKFAIGAGFKLPYSGSDRKDQHDFQFKEYKIKLEEEAWRRDYQLKSSTLFEDISSSYQLIQQEKARLNLFKQKFSNNTILLQATDHLLIEETILDMKDRIRELTHKLYTTYLQYLIHAQWISHRPLKNYFYSNLPDLGVE